MVFRRLNRTEYENSVQDLLSLPNLKLADRLPPDAESDGFDNVGAALNTSPVQLARYLEAAGVALREAMAMGPRPKVQLRAVKASEFRLWTNAYGQAQVSGTNVVFLRQALDHVWPMPTVVSRVAGEYRLRLRGFGTTWNDRQLDPPDRQHVARLYSGNRLVGTFDLNNGVPGEVEFKIWVNRGDQMVIEFPTLDAREAMAHLLKRGKPYRGAGVALDRRSRNAPDRARPGFAAAVDCRGECGRARGAAPPTVASRSALGCPASSERSAQDCPRPGSVSANRSAHQ